MMNDTDAHTKPTTTTKADHDYFDNFRRIFMACFCIVTDA